MLWLKRILFLASLIGLYGCLPFPTTSKEMTLEERKSNARLSLFIGVDVSGSFKKASFYDDAIRFLAYYIQTHLNGYGDAEIPHVLFVGSIGGSKYDESKTFFPIQTFEGKSLAQIERTLHKIFPATKKDQFTDFNVYFKQVQTFVRERNLVLRPIEIVLLSDGRPNVPKKQQDSEFRKIDLSPLENLARSVTLRLLYTDPVTAEGWRSRIPRQRVKIWTQDAVVMRQWDAPHIFIKNKPLSKQAGFFQWLQANVDFPVRAQKVE